jgi:hypothetical protein
VQEIEPTKVGDSILLLRDLSLCHRRPFRCRTLRALGFFGFSFLGFRYAPPQALRSRPLRGLAKRNWLSSKRSDKLKFVGHFLESESLSLFQKTKRKYLVPADVSNTSIVTNRLGVGLCPKPIPPGIRARLSPAPTNSLPAVVHLTVRKQEFSYVPKSVYVAS